MVTGDGRHAHQRTADPLLPEAPAAGGEHFEFAAFGVERDDAVLRDSRGGPIVSGLVGPEAIAGSGIEGVERMAAEAASDEYLALGNGRAGERTVAGNGDLSAGDPAVGRPEGDGVDILGLGGGQSTEVRG